MAPAPIPHRPHTSPGEEAKTTSRRWLRVGVAVSLLAGLGLAGLGPTAEREERPGAWDPAEAEPSPVLASFLVEAQQHIAEREYWARASERGLQAPNRHHNFRTWFEPDGIRVVDREDPRSPELVGLRLEAWGREGALARAGRGELAHERERVELRREGLVEWYVNGPEGLEHGFTVESRPEGNGELVLALAAEGTRMRLAGDAVRLQTDAGRNLHYGKLLAWDARGTPLATRFEVPEDDCVRLVVSEAGAVYPLTIDPLLTEAADTQLESDQTSAQLGHRVSSAGDVNGDGYDDVIVGAPLYDAGQVDEGAAFVFLGSAAGIADGSPVSAHAQLESDQANAKFGSGVSSAGDVNGDGYADVIVAAEDYNDDDGAAFVFLGSASGIADGDPSTAHAQLESDQALASFGIHVCSAGDVNGDGYADVIVGGAGYDAGETNEGAAFVFLGNSEGRPVLARQRRGDGSGIAVQPWGLSQSSDGFAAEISAHHPHGTGRVKAEFEACSTGVPFGDVSCTTQVSPSWLAIDGTSPSVVITETFSGLSASTLYRWRARVLYAPSGVTEAGITPPPNPSHGPWRRLFAQASEADIRVLPEPGGSLMLGSGLALLVLLHRSQSGRLTNRTVRPR